jgi:hypothetical protein
MTKIAFVVTGFSSFHGVTENPTERLIKWLRTKLQDDRFLVEDDFEVGYVHGFGPACKLGLASPDNVKQFD